MSQELVNFFVPVGLNWNEHSLGSAVTTTLADACALARSGLAAEVSAVNSGKYVRAAIRQPAMMMGLRPSLSDSVPKIRKNGVPISSDTATMMLAVAPSTFSACVRKNSA